MYVIEKTKIEPSQIHLNILLMQGGLKTDINVKLDIVPSLSP